MRVLAADAAQNEHWMGKHLQGLDMCTSKELRKTAKAKEKKMKNEERLS